MVGKITLSEGVRMTGSLQEKRGKFYIVLNTYDAAGKRKQKWIATDLDVRGNKKRAERLLAETVRQYEERERMVGCDMPFGDAIRNWLKEVALRVDDVTMQGYDVLTKRHILPYFDALGVKLADVDRKVLQVYFDEKRRNGRIDGLGGLSPKTLRMHKNILHQTLKAAQRDGMISSNPCEFVTLPKKDTPESNYFSAEQVKALLDACEADVLCPLLRMTAVYGLRRSEVLGLKWDSIDFETDTLIIKHTVAKVTKVVQKDKTKTASSRRSFPLLPEIKEMLLELECAEGKNRKLFGREYCQNDYIFKWDDGRPFSPDYVSHHFSDLLDKHGFPHIRFHELRHSCASILVNQGATLKDVQEWLGHSDINVTAGIYVHLDIKRKQGIAAMMANQLMP